MTVVGIMDAPLRVAIIGSGPAAFYAVEHLFRQTNLVVSVDMFERLPTPFGLVRFGVAPDHPKIKSVTKVYDRLAANPNFRFFGNVEYGKHISLADLREHYHQILFATGAPTDRKMNIPGEDLPGSYTATEFVAWYNGQPEYRERTFDLSHERAAIVGVGNVAADVVRILLRSPAELAKTDIADYALDALRQSRIKEVYLLGRRGPMQAAFTPPELKELGELEDTDTLVDPAEVALDALSAKAMETDTDTLTKQKVQILQQYATRNPTGKPRKLFMRFLVSPVELFADGVGRVAKMKIVHNVLAQNDTGAIAAKPTNQFEELPVGLVFRSVGYRGLPLPEIPFNERAGTILNQAGRILDSNLQVPIPGLYATGWIKRGPSGVIGTNKPDSVATVNAMLEDLASGKIISPAQPERADAERFVRARQPQFFSYADWQKLDALEVARGAAQGRPRVKFTSVEEMLAAVGK
ncbi:MAG: FAD-dependent oxidoreductase [Chloroflexi bacterium]|nr:FAD-dependent oxidoreductase [Chloroflexota bacterium]